MADQKSRGGQKAGTGGPYGERHRGTHPAGDREHEPDMKKDAARGRQGNQGGYHGQHGANRSAKQ